MTKIYLLWDFEELCGVFSTLDKAKEAARKQISYRKREHLNDARRYKRGKIGTEFECLDSLPKGFKRSEWRHWVVGYEILDDDMTRSRTVGINEMTLDKFHSLLMRICKWKDERKRRRKRTERDRQIK